MDKQTKYEITSLILMAVVVTLTIGYSLLSSNLNINGSSSIKEASWDIHFENIQVKTGSVSASTPVIDTNKTTVTYNVTLTNPGDYYEFTVDVKNAGSIDGMIESVSSRLNGAEISTLPNYLEYSVTYNDDRGIYSKQKLSSNAKETYKIHIGYKKDVVASDLPTTDQNLALSFTANFTQADSTAQTRLLYYIPSPCMAMMNPENELPEPVITETQPSSDKTPYLAIEYGNGNVARIGMMVSLSNQEHIETFLIGADNGKAYEYNKNLLVSKCQNGTIEYSENGVNCTQGGNLTSVRKNGYIKLVEMTGSYTCIINEDGTYSCKSNELCW